jgi:hypothetical protein
VQNTRSVSFHADPGPAQGAGLLSADAAEHTHSDVRPQAFSPGYVQNGRGLVQVERLRRPPWLPGGYGSQVRHVPDHEVIHHRVRDGLDQDHPGQPNAPGRQALGQPAKREIDVLGLQFGELMLPIMTRRLVMIR